MKKLKFMLAAATAIGLASALQAGTPVADEPQFMGSTDFEDYSLGAVTAATDSIYFALPASAEEGDYQIVESAAPSVNRPNNLPSWFDRGRNQILQLEGGTDPLERKIAGAGLVDLTAAPVYVDTLVQFTVTPVGDTVTAQSGDKLMVYLQVTTNALGEASTNLMAKAGYLNGGSTVAGGKDYVLTVGSGTEINAGEWHRLTVKAIKDVSGAVNAGEGCLGFTIAVDGEDCTADSGPFLDTDTTSQDAFQDDKYFDDIADGKVLISILAFSGVENDQKLQSVGFAGSGLVDDLVFTTLDPEVTFLTFTLAWSGAAAFAQGVNYTCGELSGEVAEAGTTVWCPSGTNIVVTYTYNSSAYNYAWTVTGDGASATTPDGDDTIVPVAGGTATLSASAAVTTVDFTFAGNTGVNGVIYTTGDGSPLYTNLMTTTSVNAGTVLYIEGFVFDPWYVTASDSDVKAGDQITISVTTNITVTAVSTETGTIPSGTTLADVGISSATGLVDADLDKVAKWAYACVGSDAESIATVNTMSFVDGVPQNTVSEAYLLNTNATAEAVAQAKAEFAFTSFDPANPPTAADFDSKGYNGTVTIKKAISLSSGGVWFDDDDPNPPVGIVHFYKAILTK